MKLTTRLLNLRCPGNNGCDDPVECQSYEASEQNAPCPPGCCVMAEEKDVRSILAAIDEENKPFPADQPVGEVVDVTHAYGTIVRWQRDMKRGELLYASPPVALSRAEQKVMRRALLRSSKIVEQSADSAVWEDATLPTLPGQKALTFLMQRDDSADQADAIIATLERGDTTFIPTPISEMFFHQLRLRVVQDPTLIDKIAVYYLTTERRWQEVGLRYEDELRWPVGFCDEAYAKEIEINAALSAREGSDA